ncbi:MAG: hypothetical protein Q8R55_04145 [Candidatus Taylorbacteria bacterium]|nr:hypothetical protein [Candidatus Taylorbacteria bacterium]
MEVDILGMKKAKLISLVISGLYLVNPGRVLAQIRIRTFQQRYLDILNDPIVYPGEVVSLGARIAGFLIFSAEILAAVVVVWSGIMYMSAGSDETKVKNAKAMLKNGLIGALILFGVGVILNTVANFALDPVGYF